MADNGNRSGTAPIDRRRFLRILLSLGGLAVLETACLTLPELVSSPPDIRTTLPIVTQPATLTFVPHATAAPPTALADKAAPTIAQASPRPATAAPALPPTDLEGWLKARPKLAAALVWQSPDNRTRAYAEWTAAEKSQLITTVDLLRRGNWRGLPAEPSLAIQSGPNETALTRVTPDTAWTCFLAYAAQTLVAEMDKWVGWSIAAYTAESLAPLLDSRQLFEWDSNSKTYWIPLELGHATPGDPYRTYVFAKTNGMIRSSPRQSIAALLDWCRDNLTHFVNDSNTANVYQHWQYNGAPPVEKIISGTVSGAMPSWGTRHWTAGCWGTTGFMRAVLRTVNIPVKLVEQRTHALPWFHHEDLFLSHADDPYNAFSYAAPAIPADELLIDRAKFSSWFGGTLSDDARGKNVGRRTRELAIQYLPNALLYSNCRDTGAGKAHANGEVYGIFKDNYILAQLEAARLWERMDAKIASAGGCSRIPQR